MMKIVYEYSHLGGSEILQVRYPDIDQEINEIIASVTAQRTKVSREKTRRGQLLYSPIDMNRQFRAAFRAKGYRELRDIYTITIPNSDVVIPRAFKQIDFVKGKVLVEVSMPLCSMTWLSSNTSLMRTKRMWGLRSSRAIP